MNINMYILYGNVKDQMGQIQKFSFLTSLYIDGQSMRQIIFVQYISLII